MILLNVSFFGYTEENWGYSSAGRAFAWHAKGRRFDPCYLHQVPYFPYKTSEVPIHKGVDPIRDVISSVPLCC